MKRKDMLTVHEPLKKRKKLEMLFSTTEFLEIARFCFPEQQFILEQMGDPFPESFWEEIFDSLHDYKPKLSFFTRLLGGQYECHCAQSRLGIYTNLELAQTDMIKIYERAWFAQAEHWLSQEEFDKGHEAYLSKAQINELFLSFSFSGEMHDLNRIGVITLENEEMPSDQVFMDVDTTKDWVYLRIKDDIRAWLPDSALGLKAYTADNRSFREKVRSPRWYMLYHIKHYRDCFFCLDGTVTEDPEKIKEYYLSKLNNTNEEDITMERLKELELRLKELFGMQMPKEKEAMKRRMKLTGEVSAKVSFLKPLVHLSNSISMCKHDIEENNVHLDEVQVGTIVRFDSPHMHAGMSLEERLNGALPDRKPINFDPLIKQF